MNTSVKDTLVGAAFTLVFFGVMMLTSDWWGDAGLIVFLIVFWLTFVIGAYAIMAIIRRTGEAPNSTAPEEKA